MVLRVEDLDTARIVAGSERSQLDDLGWLGLRFDESPSVGGPAAPYRQSERLDLYQAALRRLDEHGLTYLCDCSRAEIAQVASAPHAGDEGPRYPGTCRSHGTRPRAFKRPPAVRLAVPERRRVVIEDGARGALASCPFDDVGDFVLRRGDGVFAYQLAVVVDDLAMGITEVVRGVDLASSAPRQALLSELLGGSAPRYVHVPLLVSSTGQRLAKRDASSTVADVRARGTSVRELLAALARAYGHDPGAEPDVVGAVAAIFEPARWSAAEPVPLDRIEVAA
jgi:glutamyl-tRNA synthetase